MKRRILALALLLAAPAPALAFHCPADMAKIDALLEANPDLPSGVVEQVRELRADGQRLHEQGDHAKSVSVLGEALLLIQRAI